MSDVHEPTFLSEAELPAVRHLLLYMQRFGPAAGAMSPGQARDYCGWTGDLDAWYARFENEIYKGWLDIFFRGLIFTPSTLLPGTSVTFSDLYIAYAYGQASVIRIGKGPGLVGTSFPVQLSAWSEDMWSVFVHGSVSGDSFGTCFGPWEGNSKNEGGGYLSPVLYALNGPPPRPKSPVWKAQTDTIMANWGDAPPPALISRTACKAVRNDAFSDSITFAIPNTTSFDGQTVTITFLPDIAWANSDAVVATQSALIDKWSDFPDVQTATAGLWSGQADQAKLMLAAPPLSGEAYLFLLHLLPALVTGEPTSQRVAAAIAQQAAPSPTNPNDVFANQLVYSVLLTLADPLGARAWPQAKIAQFVADLRGIIVGTDPASALIAGALDRQAKILSAASGYPMQDPYSNNTFDVRQADTLAALDTARGLVHFGLAG